MSSCNSVECCNSVEALLERTGGNYPNGGKKEGVVMDLYTAHDRAIKRIKEILYRGFDDRLYNFETGESVDEGQKSGRKRSVSQQK